MPATATQLSAAEILLMAIAEPETGKVPFKSQREFIGCAFGDLCLEGKIALKPREADSIQESGALTILCKAEANGSDSPLQASILSKMNLSTSAHLAAGWIYHLDPFGSNDKKLHIQDPDMMVAEGLKRRGLVSDYVTHSVRHNVVKFSDPKVVEEVKTKLAAVLKGETVPEGEMSYGIAAATIANMGSLPRKVLGGDKELAKAVDGHIRKLSDSNDIVHTIYAANIYFEETNKYDMFDFGASSNVALDIYW
eukprot:Clim_evm81s236 gene=Clim_evmTU81s236